jgi:hypothetical protein
MGFADCEMPKTVKKQEKRPGSVAKDGARPGEELGSGHVTGTRASAARELGKILATVEREAGR